MPVDFHGRMISLTTNEEVRVRSARRCREQGIMLLTFSQMKGPGGAPRQIQEGLRST